MPRRNCFLPSLFFASTCIYRTNARRISVKWQKNQWYAGEVRAYEDNPSSPNFGRHNVVYDDGDKKW